MSVHAEIGEQAVLPAKGFFNGAAGLELGKVDIDAAGREGGGEHEDIAFEEGDAIHAPGSIGEFFDELLFGRSFGFVLVEEALRATLEAGTGFGGVQGGLAGRSLAVGVQVCCLVAPGGAWSTWVRGGSTGGCR